MHHVLLVEDDAVLRASLIRALQDVGDFSISGVGYLAEAVRAIDAHTPSLVIADLDLPDGIGLDLLPELAARGLKVPVVFITAHHSRFSAELPTNPSVQVITKPFDPEELRAVVLQRLSEVGDQEPAFAVSDYLQLAGMAKRSVRIQVTRGAQELGEIVVLEGEPRWASDQLGQGEPAFRRLALLPRATVICQSLSGPLTETNLSGSLEHLLIDAARQADEVRRNPPAAEAFGGTASAGRAAPPRVPRPPLPPRPSEPRLRASADSTAPTSPPPAFKANPQEKVVNLTKSKPSAQQVLALDPTLKTFARADRQGSVLELAGELDAETACAVATMASREVADVASELGLGKAQGWQLSFAGSTWYVVLGRDELVLGQGSANKNPGSLLKKLTKTCGV